VPFHGDGPGGFGSAALADAVQVRLGAGLWLPAAAGIAALSSVPKPRGQGVTFRSSAKVSATQSAMKVLTWGR
jgi:hypothetical protein